MHESRWKKSSQYSGKEDRANTRVQKPPADNEEITVKVLVLTFA